MSKSAALKNFSKGLLGVGVLGAAGAAAALAWGSIERKFPVVREYDLLLPAEREIDSFTLLQISDLHLYPGQEFIIDFLAEVGNTYEVDFVLSTGDNFGDLAALPMIREAYAPFAALPGAFVFGSNDYYSPRAKSWTRYLRRGHQETSPDNERKTPDLPTEELRDFLLSCGWVDVNNASAALSLPHARLALTGVDDPHIRRDRPVPLPSSWAQPGVLSLGITHAPYRRVVDGWTVAGADLIVAGHTHGGQFGLPGVTSLVTNCDLPATHGKGLHPWQVSDLSAYTGEVKDENIRSWLHVSAGLGTSPYVPFRIATRPEVSVIHIYSA